MRGENTTVLAVGDDDQSIFGFRLADPRNMPEFVDGLAKGCVIRLEQNYRSTGAILNSANGLIENNSGRLGKNLWTEAGEGTKPRVLEFATDRDEANHIAKSIRRMMDNGIAPNEIAILYRSNAQSRGYEAALMSQGVPYLIYGGLRFYERMEIKNVLAYMRLIVNVNDDGAYLRIINFPPRKIGDRTIESIAEIAKERDCSLLQACTDYYQGSSKEKFESLPQFIDYVIQTTGLGAEYAKKEEHADRVTNLKELVAAAAHFCRELRPGAETQPAAEILDEFLTTTVLQSASDNPNGTETMKRVYDPKAVTLMTVHASKGLEFGHVFLGGLEEELFPHKMSLNEGNLEEERRLAYVAITRAKQGLTISYAAKRLMFKDFVFESIPASVNTPRYGAQRPPQHSAPKTVSRMR
jgi:DNA helicase-2/ATP-dependent DNA helicase PcrA